MGRWTRIFSLIKRAGTEQRWLTSRIVLERRTVMVNVADAGSAMAGTWRSCRCFFDQLVAEQRVVLWLDHFADQAPETDLFRRQSRGDRAARAASAPGLRFLVRRCACCSTPSSRALCGKMRVDFSPARIEQAPRTPGQRAVARSAAVRGRPPEHPSERNTSTTPSSSKERFLHPQQ